jgi:hypothetical protein
MRDAVPVGRAGADPLSAATGSRLLAGMIFDAFSDATGQLVDATCRMATMEQPRDAGSLDTLLVAGLYVPAFRPRTVYLRKR